MNKKILTVIGVIAVSLVLGVLLNKNQGENDVNVEETEEAVYDEEDETEVGVDDTVYIEGWGVEKPGVYRGEDESNNTPYSSEEIINVLGIVENNFLVLNDLVSPKVRREIVDGLAEKMDTEKGYPYGGISEYYLEEDGEFTFYFYTNEDWVYEIRCTRDKLISINESDLSKSKINDLKIEKEANEYTIFHNDISSLLTIMTLPKYQELRDYVQDYADLYDLLGIIDTRLVNPDVDEIVFYINTEKSILKGIYHISSNEYELEEDSRSLAEVKIEISDAEKAMVN